MDILSSIGVVLTSKVFAVAAFVFVAFSPKIFKKEQNVSSLQSTAVSLGILGTFLGIFGGMLQFDVKNIENSIPILLGGLRLAFLTPIAGMMTSLLIKHFPKLYGITNQDDIKSEEDQLVLIRQELSAIAKSLSGDEETTLITQIQKMRVGMLDKQDELNKSFKEFAAKMVSDNTQSLVDALTQVMKDFNTKISEQFGDNFKQLNEAVGRMLVWQDQYKEHIETTTSVLKEAQVSMQSSKVTLEAITEHAKSFSIVSSELGKTISSMNDSKNRIEDGLRSFDEVSKTMKESFGRVHEGFDALRASFKDVVDTILKENSKSVQDLTVKVREINNESSETFKKIISETGISLGDQVKVLDEKLGEELNKSLQTLGSQLTSLSKTFVEDYSGLTTKLRQILQDASK